MKKYLGITLILILDLLPFVENTKVVAQNLVPNWSFETFTLCPNAASQLPSAVPWTGPTNNSSDYFNACASFPFGYNVPYSGTNFQYAKDGVAYTGIYLLNGIGNNYREYIEVQLNDSLTNNKCYYAEFFVSLHDKVKTACNNIAANFSKTQYTTAGTGAPLGLAPHIQDYNNPVISDTLNWIKVSGVYIAGGGEKYITIGNFKNDISTDTINLPYGSNPGVCYYQIDAVSVYSINPTGALPWTYRDTTVNVGDSVYIGNTMGGSFTSNWYKLPGTFIKSGSGIYVKPTVTSQYVVTFTICGVPHSDTLKVVVTNTTSVKEFGAETSEFVVSPNPNSGLITIEILSKEFSLGETELKIVTILGQEVKRERLVSKKQQVDISELSGGIYYLQLQEKNKILLTRKVIKQ
jgi:hypothetical protein